MIIWIDCLLLSKKKFFFLHNCLGKESLVDLYVLCTQIFSSDHKQIDIVERKVLMVFYSYVSLSLLFRFCCRLSLCRKGPMEADSRSKDKIVINLFLSGLYMKVSVA